MSAAPSGIATSSNHAYSACFHEQCRSTYGPAFADRQVGCKSLNDCLVYAPFLENRSRTDVPCIHRSVCGASKGIRHHSLSIRSAAAVDQVSDHDLVLRGLLTSLFSALCYAVKRIKFVILQ